MDPLIGSALISSAAAAGGNFVTGAKNKRVANAQYKYNKKLTQMNQEYATREAEKARQYQSDEWNRQFNITNDKVAERQRLEKAGYNAALLAGNGQLGSATSTPSTPGGDQASPSSSPGVNVPSTTYDFSGVSNAVNSYYQNLKTVQETRATSIANDINNQFGKDFMLSQIRKNLGASVEDLDPNLFSKYGIDSDVVGLKKATVRQELSNMKTDQEFTMANTTLTFLSGEGQKVINKYLDDQQQAELAVKLARVGVLSADKRLKAAQERQVVAQIVKTQFEARGIQLNNKQLEAVQASYIQAMKQANYYQADYYKYLTPYARFQAEYEGDTAQRENEKARLQFEEDFSGFNHAVRKYFSSPIIRGILHSEDGESLVKDAMMLYFLKGAGAKPVRVKGFGL